MSTTVAVAAGQGKGIENDIGLEKIIDAESTAAAPAAAAIDGIALCDHLYLSYYL